MSIIKIYKDELTKYLNFFQPNKNLIFFIQHVLLMQFTHFLSFYEQIHSDINNYQIYEYLDRILSY